MQTALDTHPALQEASDLNAEGRDARAAVAAVVREVLGVDPAFDPERDITVEVVDVVDGDPHSN